MTVDVPCMVSHCRATGEISVLLDQRCIGDACAAHAMSLGSVAYETGAERYVRLDVEKAAGWRLVTVMGRDRAVLYPAGVKIPNRG